MNGKLTWGFSSMALAVAGTAVATYLTVVHYNQDALVCGVGDCHTVQSSPYAEVAGVPIALLGLGMYLAVIGLGLLRWRRPQRAATLTTGLFALVLAGTLYAAYLTYLEIAVIRAICQWCVISAILTLGILLAEGIGVYRFMAYEPAEQPLESK